MQRTLLAGVALFAAALLPSAGHAQGTVKIGLILPFSGQFGDTGTQMENGIKLYLKQHDNKLGGMDVAIVRKDTGGINPPVAKRLAQELVTRDHVDVIAGFSLTPNAFAAADVATQAKKLMVVMNAATEAVVSKSPYIVRTSFTVPQLNVTLGKWAATQGGVKKAYTMVSDFGPGHDAEQSFEKGFKAARGEVVGSVHMAVANPDFSAYVQRAKDLNPQGIYVMVPGGSQPPAFGKALSERGIDPQKTSIMGQMEIADEQSLKSMGDASLGIITTGHYDVNHKSKMNEEFVKAYNAEFKRDPDFFSIGAYDGAHMLDLALKKAGKTDGDALVAAAKGLSWESPRGPMAIDPATRDVVQTVYIRKVQKVDGKLVNVEIAKFAGVK